MGHFIIYLIGHVSVEHSKCVCACIDGLIQYSMYISDLQRLYEITLNVHTLFGLFVSQCLIRKMNPDGKLVS